MKRFKLFNVLVLMLVLFLSGLSQGQDKNAETADDLLIKFIEFLDKKKIDKAIACLQREVQFENKKLV